MNNDTTTKETHTMTTTPEYPIVSSADLQVGQQYRYGPHHKWVTAHRIPAAVEWVEAKPAPPQPGDRVRWENSELTATVKYATAHWLIVQVDEDHGDYEDAWAIAHAEPMEGDR